MFEGCVQHMSLLHKQHRLTGPLFKLNSRHLKLRIKKIKKEYRQVAAMEIVLLCCEQLPGVTILEIRNGQFNFHLAHIQQFVGLLKGNMEQRGVRRALVEYFNSPVGKVIGKSDGGDLLSAIQKGPLDKLLYAYRLKPREGGSPSRFVTMDGVRELVKEFPKADEAIRARLKWVLESGHLSFRPFSFAVSDQANESIRRAEKRPKISNEGVYVLKFTDGLKPSFYVGKSKDIGHRIQQHADGNGARCVSGRSFTKVRPVTNGTAYDMENWERNEVLELMYQYGINAVRGWKYTIATMSIEQKLSAFDDVCERFDLCRRCGRGTHFVRDCESLTTNRWADGLELRSMYHMQPTESGLNEALGKAVAEVEEERGKRLEAERRNSEAVRILLAQSNGGSV
jgi:hypothetical protein